MMKDDAIIENLTWEPQTRAIINFSSKLKFLMILTKTWLEAMNTNSGKYRE